MLENLKIISKKDVNKLLYSIILVISVMSFSFLKEKSLGILVILNLLIIVLMLKKSIKEDFFSVKNLFILNYSLYVLYIPIKMLDSSYNGELAYYLTNDRALGAQVVLVCGIIALLALELGSSLGSKFNKKIKIKSSLLKKVSKLINKYNKYLNVNVFANVIVIMGLLLFVIGIIKQGGLSYLFSEYIWNSDKLAEIGIMTTGVQIAFTGVSISFYLLLTKSNFKLLDIIKWPIGYVFLIIAGVKFIQGGRIQVLMAGITLVLIYNYTYKKIKIRYVVGLAILGIMMMGFIGYFRDYKTFIPSDLKTMIHYMLGGSAGMEYILNSYTNFTSMHVINLGKMPYLFGLTVLDGIIFLIPRAILPNKDNILFTNRRLNELNNVEVISPVGGLNLAAQNLINGYVIYTIVFMIVLGFGFYFLNRYRDNSKYGKLLYSMIVPYLIISLVRNPMFYTVKEVLQFVLIPFIIFIILKLGDKNEQSSV